MSNTPEPACATWRNRITAQERADLAALKIKASFHNEQKKAVQQAINAIRNRAVKRAGSASWK